MNYAAACDALKGQQVHQLKKNIVLVRQDESKIALVLYNTSILIFDDSNIIELHTGGFVTNYTRQVMNEYLPANVSVIVKDHKWYIKTTKGLSRFVEGACVTSEGEMWSSHNADILDEQDDTLMKNIDKFMKALTAEQAADAWNNPGGQCFDCGMFASTHPSNEHLFMHIEEHSLNAGMIKQAFIEGGHAENWQTAIPSWVSIDMKYVKKLLKRYLMRKLCVSVRQY